MALHGSAAGGEDFPLPPTGMTNAVCCDVVDMGMRDTRNGQKHKMRWFFLLDARDPQGRQLLRTDGKLFMVDGWYTVSAHANSHARKDVENWRGKKFESDEEAERFDYEVLVGKPCALAIVHEKGNDGKTRAVYSGIFPKDRRDEAMTIPREFVPYLQRVQQREQGGQQQGGGQQRQGGQQGQQRGYGQPQPAVRQGGPGMQQDVPPPEYNPFDGPAQAAQPHEPGQMVSGPPAGLQGAAQDDDTDDLPW